MLAYAASIYLVLCHLLLHLTLECHLPLPTVKIQPALRCFPHKWMRRLVGSLRSRWFNFYWGLTNKNQSLSDKSCLFNRKNLSNRFLDVLLMKSQFFFCPHLRSCCWSYLLLTSKVSAVRRPRHPGVLHMYHTTQLSWNKHQGTIVLFTISNLLAPMSDSNWET